MVYPAGGTAHSRLPTGRPSPIWSRRSPGESPSPSFPAVRQALARGEAPVKGKGSTRMYRFAGFVDP